MWLLAAVGNPFMTAPAVFEKIRPKLCSVFADVIKKIFLNIFGTTN
jgi:hypothetical protein